MAETPIRWRLAEDDGGQPELFERVLECEPGRGEFRGMDFLHVRARRIINEVPAASRMPFRYTINAYRGCSHACVYCYSRPTHEYLDMNMGEDFERRIVVKVNAVQKLRAELREPKWLGEHIAMGTNTDPYQRADGKYHLTRGIIGELSAAANPFSILTKSTLILRDLDLLQQAAERADVRANLSIGTLDETVWRLSEPGTPHPKKRVEAVAKLNAAGIPCGVLIAPVLPYLSDSKEQLDAVVGAVVEAGAVSVSAVMLHLRPGVREHYFAWLRRERPDLVARYEQLYPRSYAPKERQQELSRTVRRLVTRHGGLAVAPISSLTPERPPARPRAPKLPAGRQLSLEM